MKESDEQQLKKKWAKMTVKQMQPHFLFNSLVAIQELCYSAPREAADAVVTFSGFLRGYMEYAGQEEIISFEEELQLIKYYMKLQKLMYEDGLVFKMDIQTTDFSIPALSIQPFIGNAVRHGISQKSGVGCVKLSARKETGMYYVVIEDDGAGYPTSVPQTDGILSQGAYAIQRIEAFSGTKVQIKSENGKGTKIIISIPEEREE